MKACRNWKWLWFWWAMLLALCVQGRVWAQAQGGDGVTHDFAQGSLIIPMDTSYQDMGGASVWLALPPLERSVGSTWEGRVIVVVYNCEEFPLYRIIRNPQDMLSKDRA